MRELGKYEKTAYKGYIIENCSPSANYNSYEAWPIMDRQHIYSDIKFRDSTMDGMTRQIDRSFLDEMIKKLTIEPMTLSGLLSYFSFSYEMEDSKIRLIDNEPGGNLGDIEADRFDTVQEVIDRMDAYINDTFLNGEILIDESEVDFDTVQDAFEYCVIHGHNDVLAPLNAVLHPDTIMVEKKPLKMSFMHGGINKTLAKIVIEATDKPLKYRYGYAFRGAKANPIDKKQALEIVEKGGYLDIDETDTDIVLNRFSEMDMW